MANRLFSLSVGIIYVLLGVFGLVPGLVRPAHSMVVARNIDCDPDVGLLFGCLPVTLALNLLHLLIGAGGILAASTFTRSLRYTQALAAFMLLTVLAGVLPLGLNTFGGFLPLSGGNLPVHLVTATMAFYFGYVMLFDAKMETGMA